MEPNIFPKEGVVSLEMERFPKLTDVLAEARRVATFLWEKGWAEASGGNLSLDVTDAVGGVASAGADWTPLPRAYPSLAGRSFLVTGSGRRFRDFARQPEAHGVVLSLDAAGDRWARLWGGESPGFRPTSELPSHLAMQAHLRETARAERTVLHAHPTELIALSHLPAYKDEAALDDALWGMLPEVKIFLPRGVGLVPYALTGTEMLAQRSLAALERGHAVLLWEMHGALAVGRDPAEAFDRLDVANKAAAVLLKCLAAGVVPEGLGKTRLAELTQAFGLDEKIR